MDAIAGLAFGIIVIDIIRGMGVKEHSDVAKEVLSSGILAGVLMAFIYIVTILMGTQSRGLFEISENGGIALAQIAEHYLGKAGSIILALTIIFACLKTSIGLVTSCSDTFVRMFPNLCSYKVWAIIFTIVSFGFSNIGLSKIIEYSIPVLMFLYPLVISLILLALFGRVFEHDRNVYVCVTIFTSFAAVFDLIKALPESVQTTFHLNQAVAFANNLLPWFDLNMGWILPAMIGFAVAAVYTQGPLAPYGAAEGKLGTNPISWAVPRYGADPVIMDGATTIAAEGKLRAYIQKGMQVPEGWIRDGHGNNTTNPEDFYKEPKGTILPIGGLNAGAAKGSALSIMCDMFSIAYWTALKEGGKLKAENGFFLMAVNPEFFCGTLAYEKQVDNHARFIKDAKPAEGFDEVLLPGEFEFRQAKKKEQEGIDLPEETWNGLVSIGQKLGCKWSAGLETVKAKEFVQF